MMIYCPKCEGPLSAKKNHCDRCGEDIEIYVKIVRASNSFYNQGLLKAKVRDLTGAVEDLKKSLKLNKRNTNARNLLGLIYFEMGETVAALGEWVISKHFQAEENDADDFMEAVQSNPTKLETMNQAIKKYNSALLSAKQGSTDLAIIQLKKVISINTHFIRAYQLLALLYIKTGEKDKAKRYLFKARKIDVGNTTTLRYIKELNLNQGSDEPVHGGGEYRNKRAYEDVSFAPVSSYQEDKPNVFAFINLVLGIIIGIAVVFILIVPTVKKNAIKDLNNDSKGYSEQISSQASQIYTLENDKKKLESNVEELQKQIDSLKVVEYDESMYDDLFKAVKLYIDGDKEEAAKSLIKVDQEKITRNGAKDLYNLIKEETYETTAVKMYEEGRSLYNSGRYEKALEQLNVALELNPENEDTLYFLARTYHKLGENEKAKNYYNMIITDYPDTERAVLAKEKIRELN